MPVILHGWGVIILTLTTRKLKVVKNRAQIHVPGESVVDLGQESRSVWLWLLPTYMLSPESGNVEVRPRELGLYCPAVCPRHERPIGTHQKPHIGILQSRAGREERGLVLETLTCVYVCARVWERCVLRTCVWTCTHMMCTQGHMRLPCDIYSTPTVDGVTYRYLSLFRKWIINK